MKAGTILDSKYNSIDFTNIFSPTDVDVSKVNPLAKKFEGSFYVDTQRYFEETKLYNNDYCITVMMTLHSHQPADTKNSSSYSSPDSKKEELDEDNILDDSYDEEEEESSKDNIKEEETK